jgi:hypothetical protein
MLKLRNQFFGLDQPLIAHLMERDNVEKLLKLDFSCFI